jgi:hypothetical protein
MHCGAEVTESSTNKQHHLSQWYYHSIVSLAGFRVFWFCLCRWRDFLNKRKTPHRHQHNAHGKSTEVHGEELSADAASWRGPEGGRL